MRTRKGRLSPNSTVMPCKRMRLAKGWSLVRLSGISGVSVGRIRSLERNEAGAYLGMAVRTLCRLALALDCAPCDILPMLEARPKAGAFESDLASEIVRGPRAADFHGKFHEDPEATKMTEDPEA